MYIVSKHILPFCRESPQHSGVNASFFGLESTHFPGSDEHGHFKLSHCPENELDFGLSLFPNDGVNENPGDGNVGDVEISGGENSEDVEIRMDLSDDLLHLVWRLFLLHFLYMQNAWLKYTNLLNMLLQIFSFLGQRDLCKAGASCKQWRSASMHEDFWKCLKFENTRISLQNCMSFGWLFFILFKYYNSYVKLFKCCMDFNGI